MLLGVNETMTKNLNFDYIEDFVDYITDRVYYCDDGALTVSIVVKFKEVSAIVKELMLYNDGIDFEKIDITAPIMNGYEDEYVLDISLDSDDSIFFGVEPAIRDGKYLDVSNDEVYIFEDCNAKLAKSCDKYSDVYIVHIGKDDKFEDECDECECPECKTKRELAGCDDTEYRVNGKKVSKDTYNKAYKDLHKEYDEVFAKMLKSHCELMDEVNNALARFRF